MSDRMDKVVATAVRQGFQVTQTARGTWVFRKRGLTVSQRRTPRTATEWVTFINALRGAGLRWYPED